MVGLCGVSFANINLHDDVIKWKHFPRNWPFVRGIHRSPVNSPHKGQWRGALMFSLICTRINGWANNGEAGDLRRYQAHCDVIVMKSNYDMDRISIYRDLILTRHKTLNGWKIYFQMYIIWIYNLLHDDKTWNGPCRDVFAVTVITLRQCCSLLFRLALLNK